MHGGKLLPEISKKYFYQRVEEVAICHILAIRDFTIIKWICRQHRHNPLSCQIEDNMATK